MKKILLLMLFITNISYSQNKNFIIEDKLIIWKLVYEDSTNISELKNNPRLKFITDSTGFIKKTNFNDKKVRQLIAEFKVESKKGRFRVSVFNVKFFVETIGINLGMFSTQTISEYTIEESLIKNNSTIRESYLGYNLTEALNPHFTELFTIKKTIKSDW
jgi:pantoate kinase